MGDDSSVPIPNLKIRYNWWSRGGTAGVSKVVCYNHVKEEMAIRWGISTYILDTNLKDVALKYLTKNVNLIDGVVTFFERFYQ